MRNIIFCNSFFESPLFESESESDLQESESELHDSLPIYLILYKKLNYILILNNFKN